MDENTTTTTVAPENVRTMEELVNASLLPAVPNVGDLVRGEVIIASKGEVRIDITGLTTGVVRGVELYDESGEYSNVQSGDIVDATVIDIENERGEMELSFVHAGHKKAWDRLFGLKQKNAPIDVKVVGANKGGLLISLGNISGFLPVSQLAPENYPRVENGDKQKILERLQSFVNRMMHVKIIDVDEREEKFIVSEKALWEEQQRETLAQFTVGETITGKVTGIVDFGAFVELPNGLEGLIHISEIAWQRLDHPRDVLVSGQEVEAKIIAIEGARISLSLKRLAGDPWSDVLEKYSVGQVVKGKILKVNPFGLFVELDSQIHGLAHISELSHIPITDANAVAKAGEERDFKIISIEPREHRLGLSLKVNDEPTAPPVPETVTGTGDDTPADTPAEKALEEAAA
jgi:small subunit ribosomal protein S1